MKQFWCIFALCLFSVNSLAAIVLLLTGLSLFLIHEAHMDEAPWMDRIRDGSFFPAYTDTLLDDPAGAVLARLNLPACVVLDNYSYAHYLEPKAGGLLRRDLITFCSGFIPALLFTISWLAGRLSRSAAGK